MGTLLVLVGEKQAAFKLSWHDAKNSRSFKVNRAKRMKDHSSLCYSSSVDRTLTADAGSLVSFSHMTHKWHLRHPFSSGPPLLCLILCPSFSLFSLLSLSFCPCLFASTWQVIKSTEMCLLARCGERQKPEHEANCLQPTFLFLLSSPSQLSLSSSSQLQ